MLGPRVYETVLLESRTPCKRRIRHSARSDGERHYHWALITWVASWIWAAWERYCMRPGKKYFHGISMLFPWSTAPDRVPNG